MMVQVEALRNIRLLLVLVSHASSKLPGQPGKCWVAAEETLATSMLVPSVETTEKQNGQTPTNKFFNPIREWRIRRELEGSI